MTDSVSLYWEAQRLIKENRIEAIVDLRLRSQRGDPDATFILALILQETSVEEAESLFLRLTRENFDGAAYQLALLYEQENDPSSAKLWYRTAALRGDFTSGTAAQMLGFLLYTEGDREAGEWLKIAYDMGQPNSAFGYGLSLRETDPEKALALFSEAAEEGKAEAYYSAGNVLRTLGRVSEARESYLQGCRLGDDKCFVGLSYLDREAHPVRAKVWLIRLAIYRIRRAILRMKYA